MVYIFRYFLVIGWLGEKIWLFIKKKRKYKKEEENYGKGDFFTVLYEKKYYFWKKGMRKN